MEGNLADSEHLISDNDVVISGMSSLMPGCENLKEWAEKLYNQDNLVTPNTTRWKYSHPEVSPCVGLLPKVERFDNEFLMINSKAAQAVDPNSRKLLEQTYQALFDAAVCPTEISGKRIGVFIATSHPEQEKNLNRWLSQGLVGNNRAMFANRISYWLNLTGPSYVVDCACAGSTVVLQHALEAISNGHCDAAIVGASRLILCPMTLVHSHRVVPQNFDGITKSYDMNADGPTMSESVSVLYLQKYKDARRVYAQLCHAKCEYSDGLGENYATKFGYQRNTEYLSKFLRNFYQEAGVSPSSVEYVEGFGTADYDSEKSELAAIEEVFCNQRSDPLLVGSVTSNMGFSEVVSGLNGVIKILHGYQTGILAANLNCKNPRQDIPAVRDGRIQIVRKPCSFRRTYTALNSFSLAGMNGHVLLKGCYKKKDQSCYKCDLPQLVTISGRQVTGVNKVLNNIKDSNLDHEELTLLRELYKMPPSSHLARGYGLFESIDGKTITVSEKVSSFDETVRPLWFVYSGMGSQWAGMGTHLLRVPVFADAIQRVHTVLQRKGLDIYNIITTDDPKIFDNILFAFVGIASIQIGLTDVLKAVGLVPDKIIGHSVGELGCAYADDCFTTEETILLAYSRGLVSQQTPLIKGLMAAVGMGYKEISKLCPPEIDVACHNGPGSSTLSGPADVMKDFMKELTARGIFVKEVNSANIAYHSRYIAKAAPLFLKMGQAIVKKPKMRSKRWVSSSVPLEEIHKLEAKFCSAEYHTNNLLNSVLFEEASRLIPNGAVLVEIAPHGLLQAILRRSLPSDCRNIPLTNRAHSDAAVCLLEALGKLFMEGCNLDTKVLYPEVEYPVSTKTRQLSHLVEYHHENKWTVQLYGPPNKQFSSTYKPIVTLYDEEHKYLRDSVIEGKHVFPAAGVLVFVWDTFAMYLGQKRNLSVELTDIKLYDQIIVQDQSSLKFTVTVFSRSGKFEVFEDGIGRLVAEGYITARNENIPLQELPDASENLQLTRTDVYKLLFERGYEYTEEMKTINNADLSLTTANLEWNNNWTTFIDGILQILTLRMEHGGVSDPMFVSRIVIDTEMQEKAITNRYITLTHSPIQNRTSCGGVTIDNVIFKHKIANNRLNAGFKTLKNISKAEDNKSNVKWDEENCIPLENLETMAKTVSLRINNIGDFNTFKWVEGLENNKSTGISVSVHYAGLNVFDVKQAKGDIFTKNNTFGMDFSGLTKRKEPVMGIISDGAVCSHVCVTTGLLWPVPKHWSLEDAATVPLPYCLAFYCLGIKNKLQKGMTVLIHGGTGAVGQAAISIALAFNCTVFTTVSSVAKKRFLLKLFPELSENHMGNSRDETFKDMIQFYTKGEGCDIIISSVKRSLKNATLHCSAMAGTMIDLVQIREHDHFQYGMSFMTKSRSYSPVDLLAIFNKNNEHILKKLQCLVSDGIALGYVRPLSRVTYTPDNVSRAFRLLAGSRHRGRVLLALRNQQLAVTPRLSCSTEASYLIICDLDGFGLKLADKLIASGVKKLHLHLCSQLPHISYKLMHWTKLGAQLEITSNILDNEKKLEALLEKVNNIGTIDGIFMTKDDASLLSKLDLMSRIVCPELRYFVVTNGDAAALDICHKRFNDGYPAVSVNILIKKIDEINEEKSHFGWNNAIDIIEQAVFAKNPNLLVYLRDHKHKNMIVEQTFTSISSLDIECDKVDDLAIGKLSIAEDRLRQLDDSNKEDLVIEDYLKTICSDELLGNVELVPMPTMFKNANMRADDLEIEDAHMFIVTGLEGHHERFKPLCKRLKMAAAVFQLGYENHSENIYQTALRFVKVIVHKLKYKNHFFLLGYEYGVPIVMEMASILESYGMTGTVFCLGGSSEEIRIDVENRLTGTSEWKLQNTIIQKLCTIATKNSQVDLIDQLKMQDLEDKVRICSKIIQDQIQFHHDYLSDVILATYHRIGFLRNYSSNISLKSDLIIIGGTTSLTGTRQQKARYDLNVSIPNILENLRCAAIINAHLGSKLLENFNNVNLCESYLTNDPDDFVVQSC